MADPPPHQESTGAQRNSPAAVSAITKIEAVIGKDEGGRGVASLIVPGDLLSGARRLARLVPRRSAGSGSSAQAHVVVLSGFPCCVDDDPPTETDGPPGALAIARAATGLGHRVTLVTDECNRGVFAAAIGDGDGGGDEAARRPPSLELVTYPPENSMTDANRAGMVRLVRSCDLIVACERAGPAADGNCYTMRGIDMTGRGLIAPLHRIVELGREENDASVAVPFVAIGDGGNEMGMGKMLRAIVANPKIKDGKKIAAVTPADDLIAASVSNWGGYALAAAAAVVRYDDSRSEACKKGAERHCSTVQEWVDECVPTEEDEVALLERCIKAGCRDGVTGKMEATVDGMPLETSMGCLRNIRLAALEAGEK